jgi:hypothetical protein
MAESSGKRFLKHIASFLFAHFEINHTSSCSKLYEIACHDHAGNIVICGSENVHVKVAFEVGRYSTQLKAHLGFSFFDN